jgi:ABC-2 type transport system permease protein
MNSTIAMITVRGLFGRRRFLALLVLPAVLVGLAALGATSGVDPHDWAEPVLVGLGFAVVQPLVALIVGAGVLGIEVDDGTLPHILAKPLPRREIVLTKLAIAVLATVTAVAPAMFVTGVLVDGPRLGIGLAAGAALASVAYSALFLALSLTTSRPVLVGLGYLLIWEGLLGQYVGGTRVLAIRQYAVALADKVAGTDLLTGRVGVPLAVVMATLFTAGATVLAIDRLRSFRLAGESG